MRKTLAVLAAAGIAAVGLSGPAHAQELPPHGHMLVLGVHWEGGEPVGFDKCVDVAAGRALPLVSHHEHVHFGTAGAALFEAGHLFVPTSPVSPFENCAHLESIFGG